MRFEIRMTEEQIHQLVGRVIVREFEAFLAAPFVIAKLEKMLDEQ